MSCRSPSCEIPVALTRPLPSPLGLFRPPPRLPPPRLKAGQQREVFLTYKSEHSLKRLLIRTWIDTNTGEAPAASLTIGLASVYILGPFSSVPQAESSIFTIAWFGAVTQPLTKELIHTPPFLLHRSDWSSQSTVYFDLRENHSNQDQENYNQQVFLREGIQKKKKKTLKR